MGFSYRPISWSCRQRQKIYIELYVFASSLFYLFFCSVCLLASLEHSDRLCVISLLLLSQALLTFLLPLNLQLQLNDLRAAAAKKNEWVALRTDAMKVAGKRCTHFFFFFEEKRRGKKPTLTSCALCLLRSIGMVRRPFYMQVNT